MARRTQPSSPWRLAAPLALLILALGTAAWGESLEESRKVLEEIQRRITKTTKSLEEKRSAERSHAEDLAAVEKELARTRARIADQGRRLAKVEAEMAAKESAAARAREEILLLESQVRRRLTALYKGGEMGVLRVFFSASSPVRLAEDYDYFGRVLRRDRQLLADYRRRLGELEQTLQELAALRRDQQALLAAGRQEQETLRQAARLKERLLAGTRREREALDGQLAELKEKAGRLSALIKKLESAPTRQYTEKTGIFGAQKGRLRWPAEGRVKVGFGTWRHPELGTLFDSQGIEIAVAGEHPIAAVWGGRVIFANLFKGYGNLLILDHGEGYYTLYAQASRLTKKVGDLLEPGTILGYSGFEGADFLYFEIRHRGTPLDPAAWLRPR